MSTNVKKFIANNKVLATVDNHPIKSITLGEDEYVLNYDLNINYNNSAQSNVSSNFDRTIVKISTEDKTIVVGNTSYNARNKSGYEFKGWKYNGETISGNIEFYPLEDVSITAYWEEIPETEYRVQVNVSGFDVTIDGERKNLSNYLIFSGESGTSYNYTLGTILSINGFTKPVTGLSIVGITDLSNASVMVRWEPGIDATEGLSTPPTVLKQTSDNISGTITQDEIIEWTYVYKYNGYYFI